MPKKINIKGEHSNVRTLGFFEQGKMFATKPASKIVSKQILQRIKDAVKSRRELGRVVRRKQHKGNTILPASYSAAMNLANLLFPKNFPKLIATGLRESGNPHALVTYSKQIPLTRESQQGIDSFYTNRIQRRGLNFIKTSYGKYADANKASIREVARKIEESGLVINDLVMNVGIRKGLGKEFVFFEVSGIDLPQIRKYVNNLPQKTDSQKLLKSQAENLLSFIEAQEFNSLNVRTNTHMQSRVKSNVD